MLFQNFLLSNRHNFGPFRQLGMYLHERLCIVHLVTHLPTSVYTYLPTYLPTYLTPLLEPLLHEPSYLSYRVAEKHIPIYQQ